MSTIKNSSKWNPTQQRMLINDFQLNMDDFTQQITQQFTQQFTQQIAQQISLKISKIINFNTFDVLSITRADVQPSIRQHLKHSRVDPQSIHSTLPTADIIPLPLK